MLRLHRDFVVPMQNTLIDIRRDNNVPPEQMFEVMDKRNRFGLFSILQG
mgnify:CR=1 FL=1